MSSSPVPVPSALDASTQAFPVLSPAHISRVRSSGKLRKVEKGEILFEPGDTNVPFFVLLSGSMDIVQPALNGERAIVSHHAGSFTGELTMISGRRCLVRGRVTDPGEFLELSAEGLRSLVAKDGELSEIFMRAFILRRLELIDHGFGNVILMGSRHSANTLRLREFLSKNGHPHTYVDLDTDKTSQELLDRFEIKPSDIPVVICQAGVVFRNPSNSELADCLGLNVSIDRIAGARFDHRWRRTLGPGGCGVRGLGGPGCAGGRNDRPGGQAGSSSKIENYLGFPTGISGGELAERAITQAEKFGARMMVAHNVVRLDCGHPYERGAGQWQGANGALHHHCHRGAVQQAAHCQPGAVRRVWASTTARPSWRRSSAKKKTSSW